MDMVSSELTMTATEFKARCLEIFTRLNEGSLKRVTVTRRGKPVAVVTSPGLTREQVRASYGSMRGTVHTPEGFDWTASVFEDEIDAEKGILYNE